MYWRLLKLLLRRSTFAFEKIDYEKERRKILKGVPLDILTKKESTNNRYAKIRSTLLKSNTIGSLVVNLAFIKNPAKHYRKLFVSEEQKIIYLRIFKCGSTSILKSLLPKIHKTLSRHTLDDRQIDALAHYIQEGILPLNQREYTCFTVIRDPLKRIVSAYIDVLENGDYDNFLFGVFRQNMTFKDVLKVLREIPDKFRGPHFTSQSSIIDSARTKNILIFKLEDEKGLAEFLARFNLQLTYSNQAQKKYDFKSYYDLESLQLAFEIYKKDFERFDYTNSYKEIWESLEAN